MYLSILDYSTGRVIIHKLSDKEEAEDYVSEYYGLDNVHYMTTDTLQLEVETEKYK